LLEDEARAASKLCCTPRFSSIISFIYKEKYWMRKESERFMGEAYKELLPELRAHRPLWCSRDAG
jgi:hypothetical protein